MWLELSLLEILLLIIFPNASCNRIINGTVASLKELSYTVSLRYHLDDYTDYGRGHMCGGTLIRWNVVLSAAHCVTDPKTNKVDDGHDFHVVMGQLNRFTIDDYTIIIGVERIEAHSDFTLRGKRNDDITLLFLRQPVPIGHPIVRPIAINRVPVPTDTMCVASGWGATEKGSAATDLMRVDLPIYDFNKCKAAYTRSNIIPGMICAGYVEGQFDACGGDSGGPLICNNVVAGIVSFGAGCGKPLSPGVYADVAYYSSWIDEHLPSEVSARGEIDKEINNTSRLEENFGMMVLTVAILFRLHLQYC